MEKKFYLSNNRLVKIADYVKHFCVHRETASKMFHHDKTEFGFQRYTYSDFFALYGCFPSKNFTPVWGIMPENVEFSRKVS